MSSNFRPETTTAPSLHEFLLERDASRIGRFHAASLFLFEGDCLHGDSHVAGSRPKPNNMRSTVCAQVREHQKEELTTRVRITALNVRV